MSGLRSRVEDFLSYEAALLDDKEFMKWLDLYDEDAYYFVPVLPTAAERGQCMAHFDEERSFMEVRVRRLSLPNAYSDQAPTRTCRIVSNVQVTAEEPNGDIAVRANLIVHEYRVRVTSEPARGLYAGVARYLLRPRDGGFLILSKRVDLIDSEGAFYLSSIPL